MGQTAKRLLPGEKLPLKAADEGNKLRLPFSPHPAAIAATALCQERLLLGEGKVASFNREKPRFRGA